MTIITREKLEKNKLPGRVIEKAVGIDAYSKSMKMTIGFATYSIQSGVMEPHQHAEETVFITRSKGGCLRFGPEKNDLPNAVPLAEGMILHIPELEWHVFEYDEGGMVEIMYIYGQVDNIRPEEIRK